MADKYTTFKIKGSPIDEVELDTIMDSVIKAINAEVKGNGKKPGK